MLDALSLGALAQSTLLLSGLIVFWVTVPRRVVGWIAGFGAGALVSTIAFDLAGRAVPLGSLGFAIWLLVGALLFVVGDRQVEAHFGAGGTAGALGIVLSAVVDGVPESLILGISLAAGTPLSWGFVGAVLVSNVPQALAPSADLARAGWSPGQVGSLWTMVVVACALAAVLGHGLAHVGDTLVAGRAAAVAAGGLLAMLTDSLMPFAFEHGGEYAGLWTVVGFAAGAALG